MIHATLDPLQDRLHALWQRTNDAALLRLAHGESPADGSTVGTPQERSDWTSTCLMEAFKKTGDTEALALLFELNHGSFLQAIKGRLRHGRASVDANDVLQEVFLNICRYPHRFHADRANAFRCWGHRIVRNTVLKFLKGQARQPGPLLLDDESPLPEDTRTHQPEFVASEHESAELVNRAYVLFLGLYLFRFERLSPKERRVLTLAEVEGRCYRDIARELGVNFANVKMTVFRGRRRIHQGMAESLAALERMELDVDGKSVGAGDCRECCGFPQRPSRQASPAPRPR